MSKPRCLVLFEESCRSQATRTTYLKELNNFLKWANKDYESILLIPDDQLKIILEDYMLFLKRRYVRLSIRIKIAALQKFFFINDKIINVKKLLQFLPEDNKKGGDRPITLKEIQDMLSNSHLKRTRAIIHILACTGARPEAITELRIKDISNMPDGCKSLQFYAGSTHEYDGFLHEEAAQALTEYLDQRTSRGEYLKPDSFVVRPLNFIITEKIPKGISTQNISEIIKESMKSAGIKRIKTGNRYDLAVCTGFRKRFNTILKSNPNVAYAIGERLMDHKNNLESNYLRPTREQMFESFKKIIPDLMIDQTKKQALKIKQLEQEKSELEQQREENQKLDDKVARQDQAIHTILKKLDKLESK